MACDRRFNEVKSTNERKGRSVYFLGSISRRFNEFIEEAGLVDVPLVGRKFTWSRLDGRCCSKIDRSLISNEWKIEWGPGKLRGLPKGSSDHCPIFLHYCVQNWRPKPFRVFNTWLNHPDLGNFVEGK